MKKLILAILMTFGIFTMVSADIGVKLGVSAQIGSMETSGKETSSDATATTKTSSTEEALFGTAGFFIEKDLAFLPGPFGRLSVGFDNIAHDLDLGSQSNYRERTLGAGGAVELKSKHTLEAEVTDFETLYATLNVTDWLYLKSGTTSLSVKTTESLETTGSYPNVELDGTMWGFGVHNQRDNGIFFRVEANYYDIDGVTVNNSNADSVMQVKLDGINGATAKASIGKAF